MANSQNRASGSPGKSRRKMPVVDLSTARQMLPLVRSIVSDIMETKNRLKLLSDEQESLERNRRQLEWDARSRRYSLQDEVVHVEQNYSKAMHELKQLGVNLIDSEVGAVDFPTRINGRSATFSWLFGEDSLTFWRYSDEETRRPIPSDWQFGTVLRTRNDA